MEIVVVNDFVEDVSVILDFLDNDDEIDILSAVINPWSLACGTVFRI